MRDPHKFAQFAHKLARARSKNIPFRWAIITLRDFAVNDTKEREMLEDGVVAGNLLLANASSRNL